MFHHEKIDILMDILCFLFSGLKSNLVYDFTREGLGSSLEIKIKMITGERQLGGDDNRTFFGNFTWEEMANPILFASKKFFFSEIATPI